jgi:hypothetical protein
LTLPKPGEERERERERTGLVVRDTTIGGRIRKNLRVYYNLKVHRQCPFILLVGVKHLVSIKIHLILWRGGLRLS